MRHRLGLGTVLLLVLATGCGSGESSQGEIDPAAAIAQFDADPGAGSWPRSRLNTAVLGEPDATREAALQQLGAEDPDVRVASIYALSITLRPEDADALAPLLRSVDAGERALAAAGMIAVGDARAVPVLIQGLGDETPLPFGRPPLRVWEQARHALLAFTGQDFGLGKAATAQEATATAPDWEAWWAKTGSSFDVVQAPGLFAS